MAEPWLPLNRGVTATPYTPVHVTLWTEVLQRHPTHLCMSPFEQRYYSDNLHTCACHPWTTYKPVQVTLWAGITATTYTPVHVTLWQPTNLCMSPFEQILQRQPTHLCMSPFDQINIQHGNTGALVEQRSGQQNGLIHNDCGQFWRLEKAHLWVLVFFGWD